MGRVPYFYIIQHVKSGKYYAGVRHGKGCDPNELLKVTGYKTSSRYVHALIEEDGLSSFVINRIRTFRTIDEAISYEQRFLTKVNAMNNDTFINMSNGGSVSHETLLHGMLRAHGVDNYSKTPEFNEKYKATCQANWGVDHYLQTDEFKEKLKRDSQERWGSDSYMSTDEFRRKSAATCQANWGVDNYTQSADYKEKYSGKNAHNFKGYYITPYGIYTSRQQMLESNIKHLTMCFIVNVYTKNQLCNTIITQKTYNKTKYLNLNYDKSIIGMSYRELGFMFIAKESLIPLVNME